MRTRPSPSTWLSMVRLLAVALALAIGLVSTTARGQTMNYTPKVTAASSSHPTHGTGSVAAANLMIYDLEVTVDDYYNNARHDGVVGFIRSSTYNGTYGGTCNNTAIPWVWSPLVQRFDTSTTLTRTWTLYNFKPGVAYTYVARTGTSGNYKYKCGSLGTPSLPSDLDHLHPTRTGTFTSSYLMLDSGDCGVGRDYLVAINPGVPEIVWYLDLTAFGGLTSSASSGWRFQQGSGSTPDRILVTIDRAKLISFNWDGTIAAQWSVTSGDCDNSGGDDGPCLSHDAFVAPGGNAYAIVSKQDAASTPTYTVSGSDWDVTACAGSRFVLDGYLSFSASSWSSPTEKYLVDWNDSSYDYDPTVDGGPNAPALPGACDAMYWTRYFDGYLPIDWTHVNSLTVSSATVGTATHEVIDLSLKPWDQIVRYDTVDGAILWSLNGQDNHSYGEDLASSVTGVTDFANQHDVTLDTAGNILLFDNTGGGASSARVMQLQWDSGFTTATITNVWPITNPAGSSNSCPSQGSAEFVPPGTAGTSVVAMCPDQKLVQELKKSGTGTVVTASFYLNPDISSCTTTCFCGSAAGSPADVQGWTRAFQVSKIGVF